MAGSRGAAEARPRASARTRRPSLKARAQPVECEHASKPQAAGGARRGGRAAAPEGLRLLTPAPRKRPASDGGGGDGGDDTPKTGASRRASSVVWSKERGGDTEASKECGQQARCHDPCGQASPAPAGRLSEATRRPGRAHAGARRQSQGEAPKEEGRQNASRCRASGRRGRADSCQALYSSPLDGRQHGHTRARGQQLAYAPMRPYSTRSEPAGVQRPPAPRTGASARRHRRSAQQLARAVRDRTSHGTSHGARTKICTRHPT